MIPLANRDPAWPQAGPPACDTVTRLSPTLINCYPSPSLTRRFSRARGRAAHEGLHRGSAHSAASQLRPRLAGVRHPFSLSTSLRYHRLASVRLAMTARSKLRGQKKEAASSFCPFAPVESFLVAKVSIGERRCCGDIDRVVT